jgi:hypothetical protein
MGFFDRVRSFLGIGRTTDVDFGDDRLNNIWRDLEGEVSRGQRDDFIDEAIDAFQTAYVDSDVDSDERAAAREEFEALCNTYSIDIADFDWDAWRDWYEGK